MKNADNFFTIPTEFASVVIPHVIWSIVLLGLIFTTLEVFQHDTLSPRVLFLSADSWIAILVAFMFFVLFFRYRSYKFSVQEKKFLIYNFIFLQGSWSSYPFKEVTGLNIKTYSAGGRGGSIATALNLRCSDGKIYVLSTSKDVRYYGEQAAKILHIPLRQEGDIIFNSK